MINAMDTKNWNTIRLLRNGFFCEPVVAKLQNLMVLKEDKKNAGEMPAKTPAVRLTAKREHKQAVIKEKTQQTHFYRTAG